MLAHSTFDMDSSTGITFESTALGPEKGATTVVNFEEVRKRMTPNFKAKIPVQIEADFSKYGPASEGIAKDVQKAQIFKELVDLAQTHMASGEGVNFFLNPPEVRAAQPFKKGALKLVPLTEAKNVVFKTASSKIQVMQGSQRICFLEPPAKARTETECDWAPNTIFAGFWWVKAVSSEEEANMRIVKMTHNDYSFMVYENTKGLKTFDKLTYYEAPTGKASSASSKAVAKPPPAKKRKE